MSDSESQSPTPTPTPTPTPMPRNPNALVPFFVKLKATNKTIHLINLDRIVSITTKNNADGKLCLDYVRSQDWEGFVIGLDEKLILVSDFVSLTNIHVRDINP